MVSYIPSKMSNMTMCLWTTPFSIGGDVISYASNGNFDDFNVKSMERLPIYVAISNDTTLSVSFSGVRHQVDSMDFKAHEAVNMLNVA